MTDEKPKTVTIEMDEATMQRLAELMPAVAAWAKAEGAPATAPGDVIALCITFTHATIFTTAHNMIAEAAGRPPTKMQ